MVVRRFNRIQKSLVLIGCLLLLTQCDSAAYDEKLSVESPDGDVEVSLLIKDGMPYYMVAYKGKTIVKSNTIKQPTITDLVLFSFICFSPFPLLGLNTFVFLTHMLLENLPATDRQKE